MNEEAIIILCLVIAASTIAVFICAGVVRRRWLNENAPMDDLEGHEFEYYCAELLRNNGFGDVQVTKGSGDFGADILARKEDVTYAVQCKCYSGSCGVAAVQEAAAGREFYGRMVGVVMTNRYFTSGAETAAEKLRVILWDRDKLQMLEGRQDG